MSRQARKKSEIKIYHVMLRGINQQQIFEDKEDYDKLLSIVNECKAISGFQLYAYCLMGNHVHMIVREAEESLDLIFKRIGIRFVNWYNIKYGRVGHLFQDRFKSEPIETKEYFLTVLRYIHQNPIKAGMCRKLEEYPYSSYNEYVSCKRLIDTEYVFDLISKEEFVAFHCQDNSDICLDIESCQRKAVTDEAAKAIIQKISKCQSSTEFQLLDKEKRDKYLRAFREKGLSIRQISRLTGVSFNIVRRF